MREIKFRAWHKERKVMTIPLTLAFIAKEDVMWKLQGETDEYEWLEYTGLKDKNTLTDIYEGDIIDMEGNIRGNIYESPEVYKALSTCVVAGMGYEDWENTKQRLVRQGKLVAEQSNLPQILRELG